MAKRANKKEQDKRRKGRAKQLGQTTPTSDTTRVEETLPRGRAVFTAKKPRPPKVLGNRRPPKVRQPINLSPIDRDGSYNMGLNALPYPPDGLFPAAYNAGREVYNKQMGVVTKAKKVLPKCPYCQSEDLTPSRYADRLECRACGRTIRKDSVA